MKLSIYLSIISVLFISGCQTNNPVRVDLRQALLSPIATEEDFSRKGGLTSEQVKQRLIPIYEKAYLKGDHTVTRKLAMEYITSFGLDNRKKAKALFQELINKGNIEAKYFLAVGLKRGDFGELSHDKIELYHDYLETSHPEVIKNDKADAEAWRQIIKTNFSELSKVYLTGLEQCQQKIEELPLTLSPNESYLTLEYIANCLSKYSVGEDIVQRLDVIGQFQQLHCNIRSNNKPCISDGYAFLSSNKITDETSFKSLEIISIALNDIYKHHKRRLKMYFPKERENLTSLSVATQLSKAAALQKAGKLEEAANIVKTMLASENMSTYDRAYCRLYLSIIILDFPDRDYDQVINYVLLAIEPNILNYEQQYQSIHLLANLYFLKEDYKKYIPAMLSLLDRTKEGKKLIPQKTFDNLTSLLGRAQY